MSLHRGLQLGDLGLAPNEARGRRPQVPRTRIQRPQRRKVRAQARRSDLEHPDRGGQIPQPPRPQIHQINSTEQTRRRLGQQDLTAMPGGHHPRRTIQHRTEVVRPAQFGFAGRDAHPHRQLQLPAARPQRHPPPSCGEANAAHTPSPVCLNNQPPCASIALRNTSSCAASATRIPSASASHRRVEPSTSVNKNVTTPEGAGPADTCTGCHASPRQRCQPQTNFRDSHISSYFATAFSSVRAWSIWS